ncbi:DUF2972 domain-containing protein, partial [Campylobacter hepaticus]
NNIIGDLKIIFPLTLDISQITSSNVELLIVEFDFIFDSNLYDDITLKIICSKMFKILIKKSDLELMDNFVIEKLQSYFYYFDAALNDKLIQEKQQIRIKEQQYLDIYKQDVYRRKKLQEMMNYEITHIKQHRPDIVASWKYYQEFEKMCEELDG